MLSLTDKSTGESHPIESGAALPTGFLKEGGTYRLLATAEDQRSFRLLISDEEIPPSRTELTPDSTRVQWEWHIAEYAGESIITLLSADDISLEYAADIAPHPYKLGADIYRELLSELQTQAEGLMFGTTPAHVTLEHLKADCPPMAHFALLRTYLHRLENTFRTITEAPHRRLIAQREERPIHRVRQVDTRSLRTALKRMPVLAVITGRQPAWATTIATMDVPRREHTFNTSPNRYLLMLLHRLSRLCADLQQRLLVPTKDEPDDEISLLRRRQRWSDLCERYKARLDRLAGSGFLEGLKPEKPDTAALLAIGHHPAYSQFDRLARRILNPRVSLGNDDDKRLTLRPTYDIYEYWCFFQLCDALQTALPDVEWKNKIDLSTGKLLLTLKGGSSIQGTLGDSTISLTFQKSYGKRKADNRPFSVSKTCIPDFVLQIETGNDRRIIIFDAKYRSSGASLQDALDDMHVYRDAIRSDTDTSAIHAAFILTPAHAADANRYYSEEYRDEFFLGGFDLSPRNPSQFNKLVTAIKNLLSAVR